MHVKVLNLVTVTCSWSITKELVHVDITTKQLLVQNHIEIQRQNLSTLVRDAQQRT